MQKNVISKITRILSVIIALLITVGAAYFYMKSLKDILFVFVLTIALMSFIMLRDEISTQKAIVILVIVISSVFMPLLPVTCWFLPSLMLLSILSLGKDTSIILLLFAHFLSCYFAKENILLCLIYFVVCLIIAELFGDLEYSYKFTKPLIIAILLHAVAEITLIVYAMQDNSLNDVIILAVISVFINFILMMAILKLNSVVFVHKDRDRYQTINDQEFELIRKIKETNEELYYEGIHLNRYCMRVGAVLNIKTDLLRAECYYHSLRDMTENGTDEQLLALCNQYKLPEKLVDFLLRYKKNFAITSKEDAAFYIIHRVVMRLYKEAKSGTDTGEYYDIIQEELDNMFFSGKLVGSKLMLDEYLSILEVFKEEKMYYEFMCRK